MSLYATGFTTYIPKIYLCSPAEVLTFHSVWTSLFHVFSKLNVLTYRFIRPLKLYSFTLIKISSYLFFALLRRSLLSSSNHRSTISFFPKISLPHL
ncbi:hypothetical protein CW304_12190 [Bacillus sp. UFRGS-B20]|nr:hypothetical protein CW304_12190 [Bacillus sp. UFRGS-B20]